MRKLFLSAGHTNVVGKDRGATGNGYVEGDEAVRLRDLIVKNYKLLGGDVTIDSNANALTQTINFFKNLLNPSSIVVDIHFNAATPSATGTETLIPAQNTEFERELAYELSQEISRVLNIPLRGNHKGLKGVKTEFESHHGRLGWMRLVGENILLEICFITNKNDMESYEKNIEALACGIAQILYKYSLKEVDSVTHIVTNGETLSKIASKYNTTVDNIQKLNNISIFNK